MAAFATQPRTPVAEVTSAPAPDKQLPAMAPPEATIALEPVQPIPAQPVELPLVAPAGSTADAASKRPVQLVIRLHDGEGVRVGEFKDSDAAKEQARRIIGELSGAGESSWPFYAGRFIRPEAIVSVDLVEREATG